MRTEAVALASEIPENLLSLSDGGVQVPLAVVTVVVGGGV